MIIEKVLNNNAAQVLDDDGRSYVITGSGVAFQKKQGDKIETSKIEKQYILQPYNDEIITMYQDFSAEEIEAVARIIEAAEKSLQTTFEANLLIPLSDHIHFAIERHNQNMPLKNPLEWSVRRLYPEELRVGMEGLKIIEEVVGVKLNPYEATSIALHLINAQKNNGFIGDTMQAVELVEDIIKIVEYHANQRFDSESLAFSRFVVHLQFFAERILTQTNYGGKNDNFLYEQIIKNYPEAFECSEKVKHFVAKRYGYEIEMEEQVYLVIHINKIIN